MSHSPIVPPFSDIKHIFDSEEASLDYLIGEGVLQIPLCCDAACRQEGGDKAYMYRCKSKSCRKKYSIRNNTVLKKSKLKTNDIMLIIYLWISKASFETVKLITNHESKTIIDWMNTCKMILINSMDCEPNERKIDEVTGETVFLGQVIWSRFLQAMRKANYHQAVILDSHGNNGTSGPDSHDTDPKPRAASRSVDASHALSTENVVYGASILHYNSLPY